MTDSFSYDAGKIIQNTNTYSPPIEMILSVNN